MFFMPLEVRYNSVPIIYIRDYWLEWGAAKAIAGFLILYYAPVKR